MNWEHLISLRIPGAGVPMGRPRFNRYTGGARTPAKTRRYLWLVEAIQEKASHGMDLPIPKTTPIKVCIEAVYSRPTSQFRRADPDHRLAHCKRPDLDNVCKSILDGLKNLWVDDSQVCCIEATKKVGAIVDRKTKTSELAIVNVSVFTGESTGKL